MAYQSWSVTFGEQPAPAKWNILGTNDSSMNDGTGIGDGKITSTHFKPTYYNANTVPSQNATGSDVDVTGHSFTFTPSVASLVFISMNGYIYFGTSPPTWSATVKMKIDGATQAYSQSWKGSAAGFSDSDGFAISAMTTLTAASHTIKMTLVTDNAAVTSTLVGANTQIILFSNV